MRAPALAAISIEEGNGGIAEVSRLLWTVFRRAWGTHARLVTLCGRRAGGATAADKVRFAARIAWEQVAPRADWILFTHLNLLRAQSALPTTLRRRYAVFLHGIEAWRPWTERERRLVAGAAMRIANSHFTARRVMEAHPTIGPVIACPLALLPGGLHSEQGQPCDEAGERLVQRLGRSAVLIVARMAIAERYKGHDQLLEAWPRVVEHVPEAQLVVVGTGDDTERLRARAAALRGGDRILFTGFVSSSTLHALYDRCAVFAMPSRAEGFGLVYLEAMSHRLPCIGSREDAASDIVVDGETGLLVHQADIDALAEAITRVLRDPELRERLGAAGRRRAAEEYSFDRFYDQVFALMKVMPNGVPSCA